MFTGVCPSTGGGHGPRGVHGPGGAWFREVPAPRGVGVHGPGGPAPGGGVAWWRHPLQRLLQRAVRILLECILVGFCFSLQ